MGYKLPLVKKIRICGVKGIRERLEILSCFFKIYVSSKLLLERSASYNLEVYILRKNKLESLITASAFLTTYPFFKTRGDHYLQQVK
ncbi:hypothetical protein RSJ13_05325 [Clostridium botulinum]|nr:hypothetical protein RSJ13_05325 [Clostridium botulinum]